MQYQTFQFLKTITLSILVQCSIILYHHHHHHHQRILHHSIIQANDSSRIITHLLPSVGIKQDCRTQSVKRESVGFRLYSPPTFNPTNEITGS